MQSRCPICGRNTSVPAELVQFLVRCDACGTLLRPDTETTPSGQDVVHVQPVAAGRFRTEVSSNAGIAELLSPPLVRRSDRRAEALRQLDTLAEVVAAQSPRESCGGVPAPPQVSAAVGSAGPVAAAASDDLAALATLSHSRWLRRGGRSNHLHGVTVAGALLLMCLVAIVGVGVLLRVTGTFHPQPAVAHPAPAARPAPEAVTFPGETDLFPDVTTTARPQ